MFQPRLLKELKGRKFISDSLDHLHRISGCNVKWY